MSREVLASCPFCGGEAQCTEAVGEAWILCLGCHANGPAHSQRAAAVAAWNRRATGSGAGRWPTVATFTDAMRERLDANAHKGGWEDETDDYLVRRLGEEVAELRAAVLALSGSVGAARHAPRRDVLHEAADVANFAMMIADVLGALPPPAPAPPAAAACRARDVEGADCVKPHGHADDHGDAQGFWAGRVGRDRATPTTLSAGFFYCDAKHVTGRGCEMPVGHEGRHVFFDGARVKSWEEGA